jgi:nitronate monooxygenase
MGTRFIATEECDAGEEYKRLYLNCTENDVTIVRSPMKTSARVMKNTFADMLAGTGKEDYDIIRAVLRGIEGDRDGGLIFCSANAGRISRTDTVEDVFREFTT